MNFVTGGDAEGGSIFATYKDAASAVPVDGTGGVPTISSATTTSTNPLSGANSFLLTHPASNVQGEGWSYDFSIDNANKAKVLKIEFDYILNSGTFVAGSSSVDSDIEVYIYDVTNAQIIQPSSYKLLSNSSTVADHFSATFQTASNSSSYRLILHCASTAGSSFVLKLDSLSISPSQYVYGTPITDWQSYSTTLSNSTNCTVNSSQYRRVGDSIEVRGFISWSGNGAGGGFTVSLPSGHTIDTNKTFLSTQNNMVGYCEWFDNGTARKGVGITYNTTTTVTFEELTSSAGALQGTGFASGDTLSYFFQVPIVGLSSSVQMSDQADTRLIVAQVSGAPTSITNGSILAMTSTAFDTHGATSPSRFTCPVSGIYRVHGFIRLSGAASATIYIYKNGTLSTELVGVSDTVSRSYSGLIQCNAGDILDLRPNATISTSAMIINFEKVSGPSAISATESVNLRYTSTAGQSLASGNTTVSFAAKDYDSHGAFSSNTTFLAPISGKYSVKAKVASNTISGLSANYIRILVNGSSVSEAQFAMTYATASNFTFPISDTIKLNAGDAVTIQFQNGFGSTVTTVTAVGAVSLAIERIGN